MSQTPRVHKLPRGQHIAPMPALRTGTEGARLQGGMPPVPYRSASAKWGEAWRWARSDGTSRGVRALNMQDTRDGAVRHEAELHCPGTWVRSY